MLAKISHYRKRIVQLGPRATADIVTRRVRSKFFYWHLKRKALAGDAHHTWSTIAQKHNVSADFEQYFQKMQQTVFPWIDRYYARENAEQHALLISHADAAVNNTFDLLGSGPCTFTKIPWHADFRLSKLDATAACTFDAHSFYQDIAIKQGNTHQLEKDIKIPWELSRFQHLFALGYAYRATRDERYAQTFVTQLQDWWQENPFLLGVNWVGPMEVALRAINWLVAFDYFKHSSTIPMSFWQQFFSSLYDHLYYIENNWELYDGVTCNHYISDLVGYFYLCYLFKDFSDMQFKRDWCYQELLREFDKQIFWEGTSYEGSTAYHRLVTELFIHFFELCRAQQLTITYAHSAKLAQMIQFINFCTPHGGAMVLIGDNDSGSVIHKGIAADRLDSISRSFNGVEGHVRHSLRRRRIKHFKQFGLSIIKTKDWHITLRHHAFKERQITAHFHNDPLSVTLGYKGVPILVDPGSYVYTPSAFWRNHFRSVASHNTVFLEGVEPTPLDDRLFFLDLKTAAMPRQKGGLYSEHQLYKIYGVSIRRRVIFDEQPGAMTVVDTVLGPSNGIAIPKTCWNFTVAPALTVTKVGSDWHFMHQGKHSMTMRCAELDFVEHNTWVSPAYGQKTETKALRAVCPTVLGKEITITFKVSSI